MKNRKFNLEALFIFRAGTVGRTYTFVLSVCMVKFIYSEKAKKFCEISNVDLTVAAEDKSMVEIL